MRLPTVVLLFSSLMLASPLVLAQRALPETQQNFPGTDPTPDATGSYMRPDGTVPRRVRRQGRALRPVTPAPTPPPQQTCECSDACGCTAPCRCASP